VTVESVPAFARRSGWCWRAVMNHIETLGIALVVIPAKPHRGRTPAHRRRGLTPDDAARLLAHLLASLDAPRKIDRIEGVWGVAGHPAACLACGQTTRPHYQRGHCQPCIDRTRRRP